MREESWRWIFFCGYSLFAPLGILFGQMIHSDSVILQMVFKSMSAGVLIYISTTEIFAEEFSAYRVKGEKVVAFAIGLMLMTVLTVSFAE